MSDPRNFHVGSLLAMAVAISTSACHEPGSLRLDMRWMEPPPEDASLHITARVEQRTDPIVPENKILGTAGPEEWTLDGVELHFPHILYGDHRIAIVEVRGSPSTKSPVLYYGLSEPFSNRAGEDLEVLVLVAPRPTPSAIEEFAVQVRTPDGYGRAPSSNVELVVVTDTGVGVRLSNERSFLDDRTKVVPLVETTTAVDAPEGFSAYVVPWDLDFGREACPVPGTCKREVFARVVDEWGYESTRSSAPVVLDTRPPGLFEVQRDPEVAGPTTNVKLTVVADERLTRAPVIRSPDLEHLEFLRILPEDFDPSAEDPSDFEPSALFVYLSRPFSAQERPPDGTYALVADFEDLAGNVAKDVPIEGAPLVFDTVEPGLADLRVAPRRIGPVGEVRTTFVLERGIDDPKVTIDGSPVDRCAVDEERSPEECRLETGAAAVCMACTYDMTGAEIPQGSQAILSVLVEALDGAQNRTKLEGTIVVDFEPPSIHDVTFVPDVAALGTTALLRIVATEALTTTAAPELHFVDPSSAPAFSHRPTSSPTFEHFFLLDVNDPSQSGDFSLEAITVEDTLGNRARVDLSPGPVMFGIDAVAPVVEDLEIRIDGSGPITSPPRIGRAPGQIVSLDFAIAEAMPSSPPRVRIGTIDISSSCQAVGGPPRVDYACTYTTQGNEVAVGDDPIVLVLVEAEDAAGNRGSNSLPFVFDFRAPELGQLEVVPSPAGLDDVARLVLAASETLDPSFVPQLGFAGPSPGFVHLPAAATTFERSFEKTVDATVTPRTYSITSVTLRDVAGNEATITNAPGLLPLDWLVDNVPPVVEDIAVSVFRQPSSVSPPRVGRAAGQVVTVEFTERETNPGRRTVRMATYDLTASCTDISGPPTARRWRCTHTTTQQPVAPQDTTESVVVEVEDVAGNRAQATSPIVFDYVPPVVRSGSFSVAYTPGLTNRRATVAEATNDTTVEVVFAFEEPLSGSPTVTSLPDIGTFSTVPSSGGVYRYELVVFAPLNQRRQYGVVVDAEDVAGNTNTVTLSPTAFWVDTQAPGAVNVNTPVELHRQPWGSNATGGVPTFTLSDAGNAAESNALVIVEYADQPGVEIDRLQASSSGALGTNVIPMNDRPTVRLVALDAAGNESAPVTVRNGRWTASLFGKVPGQVFPNPHTLHVVPSTRASLWQADDALGFEANAAQVAAATSIGGSVLEVLAQPEWDVINTNAQLPTARSNFAMTYDPRRGRAVLFGGTNPSLARGTWEHDGREWVDVTPTIGSPSDRQSMAMAYDAARGEVVLFGGQASVGSQALSDTWLWSGTAWQQLTPLPSPPPMIGHAMAYDAARERIVLVGRPYQLNPPQPPPMQTWTWDGTGWTQHPMTFVSMASRVHHAMAWDEINDRVVLFGGASNAIGTTRYGDTWVWNGATWSQLSPTTSPPSRFGHAMARLAAGAIAIHGGQGAVYRYDDTWRLLGSNWSQVNVGSSRPAGRAFHGAVYDVNAACFTIWGGHLGLSVDQDTWRLCSGNQWTERTQGTSAPAPRSGHAMAYNSLSGLTVMQGGGEGASTFADTWTFDGSRWAMINSSPGTRRDHAMAYHAGIGTVYVVDGINGSTVFNDTYFLGFQGTTWVWNGAGPGPRHMHSMAQGPTNSVVVFGGAIDTQQPPTYAQDTWVHRTSSGWTRTIGATPPRLWAAMAYDARRQRTVMFGGLRTPQMGGLANDTHEWGGSAWQPMSVATPPPSRQGHAMSFDTLRGRVVLYGGSGGGSNPGGVFGDLWAWNGTAWSEFTPVTGAPAARHGHAMTFHERTGEVVVFSGRDANYARPETLVLNAGPDRSAVMFNIDWSTAQVAETDVTALEVALVAGGDGRYVSPFNGSDSPQNGATIETWNANESRWLSITQNASAATAPTALLGRATTQNPQRFDTQGRLRVRVSGRGVDFGVTRGRVALDTAEVTVEYQLP